MEAFKQDLPPKGGYPPIIFQRRPAKRIFSGWQLFVGMVGIHALGYYLYTRSHRKVRFEGIEDRSGRLAIDPLLRAEEDRRFLKQLKENVDIEERVMKNVPGWKVGHYYDEPIYKTVEDDFWKLPAFSEYFMYSPRKNYDHCVNFDFYY